MTGQYYIGIMSGTSLDGVDVALADFSAMPRILATYQEPFPAALRAEILALAQGASRSLQAIGELDHRLGRLFSDAVLGLLAQETLSARQIRAIGSHGQTVFHHPQGDNPFTMQLGDAHLIAVRTGIDTVADFRRKDMAVGGQGAPLVPAFHEYLFAREDSIRIVLNIGGIANISVLRPHQDTIGYDTGAGNMLMDAWAQRHTGLDYDKNAAFAKQGQVQNRLLEQLLADEYFRRPAPKSTGREKFHLAWLDAQLATLPDYTPADIQRSLLEFSVRSIATEIERYADKRYRQEIIVCGGGAHNPLLMQRLAQLLADWTIQSSADYGIDSDYLEAAAFAWLAYCHLQGICTNLPAVTGAKRRCILGALHRAD